MDHAAFFLYRFSVKKLPAEPVCCRIASASSLKKVNSMLCYVWFANQHKTQGVYGMNDNLSHTSWKCKYHIVFAPKYRRKSIYGTLKSDIGKILRQLCELKKVEIQKSSDCSSLGKRKFKCFFEGEARIFDQMGNGSDLILLFKVVCMKKFK